MTIREAIQNALTFIETMHGHKDGDVYADLASALYYLEDSQVLSYDLEVLRRGEGRLNQNKA